MKNVFVFLMLMLTFPTLLKAQRNVKISDNVHNVEKWINNQFSKNKVPPFSFVYKGQPSASFIKKWKFKKATEKTKEPGMLKYIFTYREPGNGMVVHCEVKGYTDYDAVEWVLRFSNNNHSASGIIEKVKVTDLQFVYNRNDVPVLYYSDGSTASINDFHPRSKIMNDGVQFKMVPNGGRSSDGYLPFFKIALTEHTGVMVAIGWTGTWFADIQQENNKLKLATGMEHLRTYLKPGETIRTPSTALLFWTGNNRYAGNNQFRQFILDHHTQKINGELAPYPISNSFNYGDPAPCNEYSCMTTSYGVAMIKRYQQFHLVSEVFWLDAGWYEGAGDVAHGKNWANTVGNWQVDSTRFPHGLGDIADAAHKAGSKFMVWFEPERVMKNSKWAKQHPDFMLDAGPANDAYLFNLGDPEARNWLCKTIGDFIEKNRIDYYRQDFNIEPEGYWSANDSPNRRGITEIKYIEGLYKYWGYLLARFPNLLIDNCASGGRRIDLETTSRSAPLWRTDYQYGEPVGKQCHTYGLNLYLPISGTGVKKTDKFTFRSSLGTCIVYNWKITDKSSSIIDMQRCQKEFKEVRPFFFEDYYSLTGIEHTTGDDIWLAYELHRPSDDCGYIVAFRRKNAMSDACVVKMKGLNPDKHYTILNEDTNKKVVKSGSELSDGFVLRLKNPRSSLLLKFSVNE